MKLIIGLGNPGEEYKNSRHNAGHMFVDVLGKNSPEGIIAKKTSVFMNNSGSEVKSLINYYKVSPENLYIVHDDLDIGLGEYKIQFGIGPKEHNGILDIEKKLKTKDFWRVRIGVDNRDQQSRVKGEEYVLQAFNNDEREILAKAISEICKKLVTL